MNPWKLYIGTEADGYSLEGSVLVSEHASYEQAQAAYQELREGYIYDDEGPFIDGPWED